MDPEALKRHLKRSAIAGAIVWTVVYTLLAVNLLTIGLGLWPIVVIPLVMYAWLSHLGSVLETYAGFTKPKQTGDVVNLVVGGDTSMTPERIAEAAARAVQDLRK